MDAQNIINTIRELEVQRSTLEPIWRDCFDFTNPERGEGFYNTSFANNNSIDTSRRATLYDSTGSDSVALFASALMSGLTPSNSKWFNLGVAGRANSELDGTSKKWLQASSDIMYDRIHSSNYDAVALEFLKDIATGGMSGLYIELNDEGELTFEQWPLYSLFVQESKRGGGIDTVYRRLHLTPVQAQNLFGNNIPETVKEQIASGTNMSERDCYVHCIAPRKVRTGANATLERNMPFQSTYVHEKSGQIVRQGGYMEMPVVIPRWALIPDTSYAVGPFYNALPDMKSLNELMRQFLTNAELVISPPIVATDDGVINPNNVKLGPREVMFKSAQGEITTLNIAGDLSAHLTAMANLQAGIRKQMLADQIAPAAKQYMTAQEIMQRQETVRALLGPLYGRLESEFLRGMLERVFGLLYRAGYLGELPEQLVNIDFKPVFTGPHARAQRMERANVILNYASQLAQLAAIDPGVLDGFDFTKAALRYGELTGVEQDLLLTEREIEQRRNDRQRAQAAQAQVAAVPPGTV